MTVQPTYVERNPTTDEYEHLIASVGWKPRERRAIAIALEDSLFGVCAEVEGAAVGCGRVIGDGGLHLYLTDVIVCPDFQRQGIGARIVEMLTHFVDSFPFTNTVVGILPTPGSHKFYERHGYKAADAPVMYRWTGGERC